MRVRLSTKLPISAEAAFALVSTPALLNHIVAPLLRFVPVKPANFPPVWQEGTYRVRILLGGVLPLGRQWIDISMVAGEAGAFHLRDNGRGDLAGRWDHRISITSEGDDSCTYVDDVEIAAGLLTPLVWGFARVFYGHRQHQWRKLVDPSGGRKL